MKFYGTIMGLFIALNADSEEEYAAVNIKTSY